MVVYPPLYASPQAWPLAQLGSRMEQLWPVMYEKVRQRLVPATIGEDGVNNLARLLQKTIAREQVRVAQGRMAADRKDEHSFWQRAAQAWENSKEHEALFERILQRYSREIHGNFSPRVYKAIEGPCLQLGHLTANTVHWSNLCKGRRGLRQKLHLLGPVEHVLALARQGTLAFVPNHVSHFDSIIMDWLMLTIGLPPVLFGAGFNLYKRGFWNYMLRRVGTYTVDRRKKHALYLETLKAYSTLVLQQGVNCLFYPGGGRSYTGTLESKLKLGLLGTTLAAHKAYLTGASSKPIFIVPITLSYAAVPEAGRLVGDEAGGLGKRLRAWWRGETHVAVRIAPPLDVLGNAIDTTGKAYDVSGQVIKLEADLLNKDHAVHLPHLGEALVKSYRQQNACFMSHIAAFTAWQCLMRQYPELTPEALLGEPPTLLDLPKSSFILVFEQVYQAILAHPNIHLVALPRPNTPVARFTQAIDMLHAYQAHAPLYVTRNSRVCSQSLKLLYYYHNKLIDYGFDTCYESPA